MFHPKAITGYLFKNRKEILEKEFGYKDTEKVVVPTIVAQEME